MQTSETDDALVAATRRGDHAAFARIIERYQRPVYAVAFSGVRDRAAADDLTQDTFVLAWRRLGELRDPSRLPAWLCGIARNLTRDARKRRRFETTATAADPIASTTPFDQLDDAQCEQLVASALAAVPETYREPLVLYYFEEQSVDDVARVLGISAETTHRRLSRGRRFLAERTHELVEQRVARRGPRAGIVAGVLATIASLGAGSRVEASPPKGLAMPKLVLVTLLVATVATVATVGGIAAGPRSPGRKPVASASAPLTPVPVTAKVPVSPAAAPAAPPAKAAPVATAARPAPALPAAASAIVVPDCAAAAKHMAALAMARLANKPLPASKKADFETHITTKTVRECTQDKWSETMRLCILDADDYLRAQTDCTDEVAATAAELEKLPAELGCSALAKHVYDLASAPDAKFGILKKELAGDADKLADLERLIAKARVQLATECDDMPWRVAKRTCIAASTSQADYARCR